MTQELQSKTNAQILSHNGGAAVQETLSRFFETVLQTVVEQAQEAQSWKLSSMHRDKIVEQKQRLVEELAMEASDLRAEIRETKKDTKLMIEELLAEEDEAPKKTKRTKKVKAPKPSRARGLIPLPMSADHGQNRRRGG